MADGIEAFDEAKNLARVNAGLKGGPFFANPNLAPDMSIGEEYPAEVKVKLQQASTEAPAVQDPWMSRK